MDKRVFGGDDYPHEGVAPREALSSHPHHFQHRAPDGRWDLEESPMFDNVEDEVEIVIARWYNQDKSRCQIQRELGCTRQQDLYNLRTRHPARLVSPLDHI